MTTNQSEAAEVKPQITEADVEYTLECEPEDSQIEGNALISGDAAEDRKAEDWVKDQLDCGNAWAWCTVRVTAQHPDCPELVGEDYLGQCSYKSEEDFKAGGYYDDMKARALEELLAKAERVIAVFGA